MALKFRSNRAQDTSLNMATDAHRFSGAVIQADSVHGGQSKATLVIQNGTLHDRFSGAAIQADSVHGRHPKAGLVVQNGTLHNRFGGAAIQADSVHGRHPKRTPCHAEWYSA